jgi:hypothetical protein
MFSLLESILYRFYLWKSRKKKLRLMKMRYKFIHKFIRLGVLKSFKGFFVVFKQRTWQRRWIKFFFKSLFVYPFFAFSIYSLFVEVNLVIDAPSFFIWGLDFEQVLANLNIFLLQVFVYFGLIFFIGAFIYSFKIQLAIELAYWRTVLGYPLSLALFLSWLVLFLLNFPILQVEPHAWYNWWRYGTKLPPGADYYFVTTAFFISLFYYMDTVPLWWHMQYREENREPARWDMGGVSFILELQDFYIVESKSKNERNLYMTAKDIEKYWKADPGDWKDGKFVGDVNEIITELRLKAMNDLKRVWRKRSLAAYEVNPHRYRKFYHKLIADLAVEEARAVKREKEMQEFRDQFYEDFSGWDFSGDYPRFD